MNIKNLIGINPLNSNITPTQNVSQKEIKSDMSHERDANGQEAFQRHKKREKLNIDQVQKALLILLAKDFMKDMNWLAEIKEEDGLYSIKVINSERQLIRELSELAIWELLEHQNEVIIEKNKGNLLKKTA